MNKIDPKSSVTLTYTEWQMVRAALTLTIAEQQLAQKDYSRWTAVRERLVAQAFQR